MEEWLYCDVIRGGVRECESFVIFVWGGYNIG